MFIQDQITIDHPVSKPQVDIQNPGLVFESAMTEINQFFSRLYDRFQITAQEFESYLLHKEPKIKHRLDELYVKIDSDVYGRFRTGSLTSPGFKEWRDHLVEWKKLLLSALRLYEIDCTADKGLLEHSIN
ncbi:hypothetical protein GF406_14565 [candidate division KSB1 bacterium]|nr:hypothetical protein [candidate division KSB1 bacterium]